MYDKGIVQYFKLDYAHKLTGDEATWIPVKCPLHQDSSASAGLNFTSQVFNCLAGCGALSFKKLAEQLNITPDESTPDEQESNANWLDAYFNPPKAMPIRKQVKELAEFLYQRKLSMDTITKWGGFLCDDTANKDNLYGYLVFPIGKGYAARRILSNVLGERFKNSKNPKTLLGKENLKLLESKEFVILVEGITDFLTLWEMGYRNVVCSMGSRLSKEQAYLLRTKTVFIIYDRDYAGHSGAKDAAELLKTEYNAVPLIVELPDNEEDKNDINDMYCKDEIALRLFLTENLTRHSTYDTDYIKTLRQTPTTMRLWHTGISSLDAAFNGGLGLGVYAFAGEEKIGKSTTVITLIHSFSLQDARVFLASYELSKVQIWARLAAKYSRYSWQELELDFSLINDDWCPELEQLSSNFKVEANPSLEDIFAARNNFDIFIVDYIQRMPSPKAGMDERSAITHNNRALSDLMAKHNKTVIMISSMPRSQYGKDESGIYKGSGDIEYTVQGGIRMRKFSADIISFYVKQNTRGANGQLIYCDVNWQRQLLTERSGDTHFKDIMEN